ncbi:MAG TPA: hypothetical protein VGI39_18320 [Polyangiaceae bacterium]|jgi:hypothetical protein
MNEDALREASRAVRETYDGQSAAAEATRHRVLAGAVGARRRRSRAVTWGVALAATLALSTAWAATTGRLARVSEMSRAVEERWLGHRPPRTGGAAEAPSFSAAAANGRAAETGSPAATESAAATGSAAATESASATSSASGSASGSEAHSARVPSRHHGPPASPRIDVAASAEEALYAKAHHAHFVEHDSLTAVRAWEAYLAAYPNGRFALEARYNRALSFVRLGWHDDARTALTPFAKGTYGGYRQREASELLEALDNP